MRQPCCSRSTTCGKLVCHEPNSGNIGTATRRRCPGLRPWPQHVCRGASAKTSDVELPPETYLVLHPPVNVPTGVHFRAPELRRDTPPIRPASGGTARATTTSRPVACTRFPRVAGHLEWLRQRAHHAMMTGSGACVFAGFADRRRPRFFAKCPPWPGWLAAGLTATSIGISLTKRWIFAGDSCNIPASFAREPVRRRPAGESPSWSRHRILIPAFEGSNPSSQPVSLGQVLSLPEFHLAGKPMFAWIRRCPGK